MSQPATPGRVWVIGGGMAGLSAAVGLVREGVAVTLVEGAAQAGGRCRSYIDPVLDMTLDNGNHLVLSGNHATFAYLDTIGSAQRMAGPDKARFDFVDVRDGRAWTLRPNESALAWWIFAPGRRVPGTTARDYLGLLSLLRARPGQAVSEVMTCEGLLWERLMQPFLLAALNIEPKGAEAVLAAAVVRETLARGGHAYRPRIAEPSLAAALVDPALAYLGRRGAEVRLGQSVKALGLEGDRVTSLSLPGEEVAIGPRDAVIVAAPPWMSRVLVPGLEAPDAFTPIVNAHFKLAPPPGAPRMVGVIGGTAEWIFAFDDRISITVSGADHLVDLEREVLTERFWADICAVHRLEGPAPPSRIVKERRATFAATPQQAAKRPKAHTAWKNLVLAGDWTDTGLPATIEGAIRSGDTAAKLSRRIAENA